MAIFQSTLVTKIGNWTGQIWPLSHSLLFPPLTYNYFTLEFVSLILREIQCMKGNNLQRDFKYVFEKISLVTHVPWVWCIKGKNQENHQNPSNLFVIIKKTKTK